MQIKKVAMKELPGTQAQHWLYPINENSGFSFLKPGTSTSMRTTVDGLLSMIRDLNGAIDFFPLSSGFRSMRPDDHLWIYVGLPLQQLVALARVEEVYEDRDGWNASFYWDRHAIQVLQRKPIGLDVIGRPPQSVRRVLAVESISALDTFWTQYSSSRTRQSTGRRKRV